jgi:tRNA threonylcarbamoyladenosine biosynthesis protein TsaB
VIVLGIETSGPMGSLALLRDGRCIEERFLPELGRRHAQSLVPEVVSLLGRHGVAASDVEGIAISVGPGSFTGLRVGVTLAKTFVYAAGAKLAAVETFRAIAENTPAAPAANVVADAQRGGLIFGRYVRAGDGGFARDGQLRLVAPDDVLALINAGDLLTGPGVERLGKPLSVAVPAAHLRLPRASIVACLGEAALQAGEAADPWTLEPLYVRKSAAEEKRDAVAGSPS